MFPSGRFAWSRRDGFFDVRDEVSEDDPEDVCVQLVAEWKRLGAEGVAGDQSKVAR